MDKRHRHAEGNMPKSYDLATARRIASYVMYKTCQDPCGGLRDEGRPALFRAGWGESFSTSAHVMMIYSYRSWQTGTPVRLYQDLKT